MIDKATKDAINRIGTELSKAMPEFHGKITFNFFNGKYVNSNVEQSIKIDNLNKGAN